MMLGIATFLVFYVLHEVEEYHVLLPWHKANRDRLPLPLRCLALSPYSFLVIAREQLALVVSVWLFLPPEWFNATIFAYAFHLLVHCLQMFITWRKEMFLPLWSAPTQLPACIVLYLMQPNRDTDEQLLANVSMIVVMVVNLALMHWLVTRTLKKH